MLIDPQTFLSLFEGLKSGGIGLKVRPGRGGAKAGAGAGAGEGVGRHFKVNFKSNNFRIEEQLLSNFNHPRISTKYSENPFQNFSASNFKFYAFRQKVLEKNSGTALIMTGFWGNWRHLVIYLRLLVNEFGNF